MIQQHSDLIPTLETSGKSTKTTQNVALFFQRVGDRIFLHIDSAEATGA